VFGFGSRRRTLFFDRLGVKDAIAKSGLVDFYWFSEVPWQQFFDKAREVQVFAISARSLLTGDHIGLVRKFLSMKGASLTVVVQDPNDDTVMRTLDQRFDEKEGTRKQKVSESIKQLQQLTNKLGVQAKVEVRVTSKIPAYSCYKFDEEVLFVPYLVEPARAPERIPVFHFRDGNFMQTYLSPDVSYICTDGSSEFNEDGYQEVPGTVSP